VYPYFCIMSLDFPIQEIVPELKLKLLRHHLVILQAPPGAGKSTILPLQLLNEPWLAGKKIIMLEPRRLAARSVATRMASLLQEDAGETIGYRIRFENCTGPRTRIEVVTEGILTRMIQTDNSLDQVGLVIFDEFHERSLQADLALALCLQVKELLRDDLRLLIMSATLDGKSLSSLLNNAPVITSSGRQFPVAITYIAADQNSFLPVRMAKAIRKALTENSGDILAFFPGAGEIQQTQELLEKENVPAHVHALYGDLPMKKQQEAIAPDAQGRRKIVLATSIAETSLTIEGIAVVIDSGYSRVPRFDPRSGLTRLETIRVTLDAADQRAGRAGRLAPGVCYRLWAENSHHHLIAHRKPEILEADLAPLMLELSQWGVTDIHELTWITPPPTGAINQAKELLRQLSALEGDRITTRGKEMLRLPTHPRIAHMLLDSANDKKQLALATDIAALLEERDPLEREAGADLSLRIEALRKWRDNQRISASRSALERIDRLASAWRKQFNITPDNTVVIDEDAGSLLASAYPERIAQQMGKQSDRYKLANGRVVKLPQHDPLMREPWLSIAHLDAGTGEGKIFLAAPINESDLLLLAEEKEHVVWDDERGMIAGTLEKRIGTLSLTSRPLPNVSEALRINILCEVIRKEGLRALNWGDRERGWQHRVMSLRIWRPEDGWPDVAEESLLQTLETWLAPYLIHVSKRTELEKLNLPQILEGMLPWELTNKFVTLAPDKLEVPSGSLIVLNYFPDGSSPVMEVRLQEVFGLTETPAVNEGRKKVTMHLLSPGYKPVQVTQDLKSFWQTTYHDVRSELRIRYQRHHWPEDPWTAEAMRGAKKRR
jgi:ATP-dependent helicase HrpB